MFESPDGLDGKKIKKAIEKDAAIGAYEVHDMHVWKVGDVPCLTCHMVGKGRRVPFSNTNHLIRRVLFWSC